MQQSQQLPSGVNKIYKNSFQLSNQNNNNNSKYKREFNQSTDIDMSNGTQSQVLFRYQSNKKYKQSDCINNDGQYCIEIQSNNKQKQNNRLVDNFKGSSLIQNMNKNQLSLDNKKSSFVQNNEDLMKKQSIYLYIKKYLDNNNTSKHINENKKNKNKFKMYRSSNYTNQQYKTSQIKKIKSKEKIQYTQIPIKYKQQIQYKQTPKYRLSYNLIRQKQTKKQRQRYRNSLSQLQKSIERNNASQTNNYNYYNQFHKNNKQFNKNNIQPKSISQFQRSIQRKPSIQFSRLSRISSQKQANNMLIRDSRISNLHTNNHSIKEDILPQINYKMSKKNLVNNRSLRSTILQNKNIKNINKNKNKKNYPSSIQQNHQTLEQAIQVNQNDLINHNNNQIQFTNSINKIKQQIKSELREQLSLANKQQQGISLQQQFNKLVEIQEQYANERFENQSNKISNSKYNRLQLNSLRQIIDREKDIQKQEQEQKQKIMRQKIQKQFMSMRQKQMQNYQRLLQYQSKLNQQSQQNNEFQTKSIQYSESHLQHKLLQNREVECNLLNQTQYNSKNDQINQLQQNIISQNIRHHKQQISLKMHYETQIKQKQQSFQKRYKKIKLKSMINNVKQMNRKGNEINNQISEISQTSSSIKLLQSKINYNKDLLIEQNKQQKKRIMLENKQISSKYECKIILLNKQLDRLYVEYQQLMKQRNSLQKQRKQSSEVSLASIREKVKQMEEIKNNLSKQIQTLQIQMVRINKNKQQDKNRHEVEQTDQQFQKRQYKMLKQIQQNDQENNDYQIQVQIKNERYLMHDSDQQYQSNCQYKHINTTQQQKPKSKQSKYNKQSKDNQTKYNKQSKNKQYKQHKQSKENQSKYNKQQSIQNPQINEQAYTHIDQYEDKKINQQYNTMKYRQSYNQINKSNYNKIDKQSQFYQIVFDDYEKNNTQKDQNIFNDNYQNSYINNPLNQSYNILDSSQETFHINFQNYNGIQVENGQNQLNQRLITFGSRTTAFQYKSPLIIPYKYIPKHQ